MTQAYNLAILANAVDTSGRLNVGTNATGTLPVANGGTGTATPSLVAGSGISVTGSFPNQTIAVSGGGGVTSLNGQTGAITNTGFENIGSYAFLANCTTTRCSPGTTIAGSNLRYQTTITQFGGTTLFSEGNFSSSPRTRWFVQQLANRENSGNTGYVLPQGSAAVSGTWRAMTFIAERSTGYCSENNNTSSDSYIGLWVRIS